MNRELYWIGASLELISSFIIILAPGKPRRVFCLNIVYTSLWCLRITVVIMAQSEQNPVH